MDRLNTVYDAKRNVDLIGQSKLVPKSKSYNTMLEESLSPIWKVVSYIASIVLLENQIDKKTFFYHLRPFKNLF